MSTYTAAIDLSSSEAAFAVADSDNKLICELHRPTRGRESSGLLNWMLEQLQAENLTLDSISAWTVGTGPGSFTGLRLVSSMVNGISFGKETVKTRGLPSALALAQATTASNGDKIAAIYDGRRSEILLYGSTMTEHGPEAIGQEHVLTTDDCSAMLAEYQHLVALEQDRAALTKSLPETELTKVLFLDHFPVHHLLSIQPENWTGDMNDLVYIRPAVFTAPKPPRTVV